MNLLTGPFVSLKSSLFKAYFEILKRPETSRWGAYLCLLLFWAQMALVPFADSFKEIWQLAGLADIFNSIFRALTVSPLLFSSSFSAHFIICVVFLALNCLQLFGLLVVAQKKRIENTSIVFLVDSVKWVQRAMLTFLAIPCFQVFISTFACQTAADGQLVSVRFPATTCFAGGHVVVSALSIVGLLLSLLLNTFAALWFHEAHNLAQLPLSQTPSLLNMIVLLFQLAFVVLDSFLASDVLVYLSICVLLLIELVVVGMLVYRDPYHDPGVGRFVRTAGFLGLWGQFMLLVAKIAEANLLNGSLVIWLAVLPLIVAAVCSRSPDHVDFLVFAVDKVQTPEMIYNHVRYLLELLFQSRSESACTIILEGFKENHVAFCSQTSCPLNSATLQQGGQGKAAEKLVLDYIDFMCREGLSRFSASPALALFYSFFLTQVMNKPYDALLSLEKLVEGKHGLLYAFPIYRYLKAIKEIRKKETLGLIIERQPSLGEGEDVPFQSLFKKFTKEMEETSRLYVELWTHLQDEGPNLKHLFLLGSSILARLRKIRKIWDKFSKFFAYAQARYLLYYGKFLRAITNDAAKGTEMIERAQKLSLLTLHLKFDLNVLSSHTDLGEIGVPMIAVSAARGNLGVITKLNRSAALTFGYTADELLGQPIKTLMPSFLAAHHNSYIERSLRETRVLHMNRSRVVFAKTSAGYLLPVVVQVRVAVEDVPMAYGQVRVSKNNERDVFIMTDHRGRIEGGSSSVIQVFELTAADFKLNPSLDYYFRGLFARREELTESRSAPLSDLVDDPALVERFTKGRNLRVHADEFKHGQMAHSYFVFRFSAEPNPPPQPAAPGNPVNFQFLINKTTKTVTGQVVTLQASYSHDETDRISQRQDKGKSGSRHFSTMRISMHRVEEDIKMYRLIDGKLLNIDLELEENKTVMRTLEASDQEAKERQRGLEQEASREVLARTLKIANRESLLSKRAMSRSEKLLLLAVVLLIGLVMIGAVLVFRLKTGSLDSVPVFQSVYINYNMIMNDLQSACQAVSRLVIRAAFRQGADKPEELQAFLGYLGENLRASIAAIENANKDISDDFLKTVLYGDPFSVEKGPGQVETMNFIATVNYLVTVILMMSKMPPAQFVWNTGSQANLFVRTVLNEVYAKQKTTNPLILDFLNQSVTNLTPFIALQALKSVFAVAGFALIIYHGFRALRGINCNMQLFLDISGFKGRRYLSQCETFLFALENNTVEEFEGEENQSDGNSHEERALIVQRKIRRSKAVKMTTPKAQFAKFGLAVLFLEALIWVGFLINYMSANEVQSRNKELAIIGRMSPQFQHLLNGQLAFYIEALSSGRLPEVDATQLAERTEINSLDNDLDQLFVSSQADSQSAYASLLARIRKENLCSLLEVAEPAYKTFYSPSKADCLALAQNPGTKSFVANGIVSTLSVYHIMLKVMAVNFDAFLALKGSSKIDDSTFKACTGAAASNQFCFFGNEEFQNCFTLQNNYVSHFSRKVIEMLKDYMTNDRLLGFHVKENWFLAINLMVILVLVWWLVAGEFLKKLQLVRDSERIALMIPPENIPDSQEIRRFYANLIKKVK